MALQAEVILYNDSPGDADLEQALSEALPSARAGFSCRVEQNADNLGFVRTANRALAEGVKRGCDVLLLNSDTIVFPGTFTEMVRVSRLDPMTGFVNPRSNNATLATLPLQDRFRMASPADAMDHWRRLSSRLPRATYVPTAVGFCLLLRWTILAEFGLFDEIYGAGYNEENDLILRAGRRGYRAVLANHAFVWHQGSASFGSLTSSELETRNAAVFTGRYPEYLKLCGVYFRSAGYWAEHLIGNLIPDAEGRLELAFDFSNVVPAHNGTFLAARRLLAGAAQAWRGEFNLHVLCSEAAYDFHRYAELSVPRLDPAGPETFAAILRVGQPYHLGALELLVEKSAVFGVFMLDTISIDSAPLVEPGLYELWQLTLEHADLIAAISDLTADQYQRRFAFGEEVIVLRSLLSLDLAEYVGSSDAPPPATPGYIFVVGNHYWHKDVAAAAEALALADPERTVVVVAGAHDTVDAASDAGVYAPRAMIALPNLVRLPAGHLTDAQIGAAYAHASVVVFPSHYEGFGFPLLNALAAKRPVFIRPLPVFEEINRALGGEGNLHVFQTTEELVEALREPPAWDPHTASPGRPGDSGRATEDVRKALTAALSKVSYDRIVARVRALRTIRLFGEAAVPLVVAAPAEPDSETASSRSAEFAAEGAEQGPGAVQVSAAEGTLDPAMISAVQPPEAAAAAPILLVDESPDVQEPRGPAAVSILRPFPDAEPAPEPRLEPEALEAEALGPEGLEAPPGQGSPEPPAVPPPTAAPATPRAFVAHRAALAVERVAYGLLGLPGVLPALRAVARRVRALSDG